MKYTLSGIMIAVYLLMAVLWMMESVISFLYEGGVSPLYLGLSRAEMVGVEPLGEGEYAISSTDGQIIWEDLDVRGGLMVLEGEFQQYPGELDLYYKREGQENFSESNRVNAFPLADGGYGYRVPIGTCTALRLDTGTEAGNVLVAEQFTVHPQRTVWSYFQPSFRRFLVFLLLPPLVSCGIYTIMEWYKRIKDIWKKHRSERKA